MSARSSLVRPGGTNLQSRVHQHAQHHPLHRVLKPARRRSIARSSKRMRLRNGFRRTLFPAPCTIRSRKSAVRSRCPSGISRAEKSHSFGGKYNELVPGERLRYTSTFDDPHLPGEMQVTVTLKKVLVGTEVNISRPACRTPFQPRLVILVGRSRCETWRSSSSPRSQ